MKNRKRFTALVAAATLTFSMVSGTGSMVLAEDDEIAAYSIMLTSEETINDSYTLSLDDSWEYTSNPSVGSSATMYVIYGTCNGENITDFSDYTFTAVVDDGTIAEADINKKSLLGIDGTSYTLDVTGLAVGSTTVTVLLQDENGNVLAASETVPVTVNEADNERTYYTIEIDEDNIFPVNSLLIKLTRVEITSTKVISTDVSDTITDVTIGTQYAYDENNNYVTSGLFSVSGSTADGWYLNVLDYGTVLLNVYYTDGVNTDYVNTYLQTWSGNDGVWVTPEQSEYTLKVGESITIEFATGIIVVARDGYKRNQLYNSFYTVDATESYNGSDAYEYCAIECNDKNVTITGLKEGSADITIVMYTPGYVGDDKVSDKQLTIHVVSADSSTGTESESENQSETDLPSETEPKNGLTLNEEDGSWYYYVNDVIDTTFSGIATLNGGSFFVANGVLCSSANGLNLYGGTWYFLANGQIQTDYTGLALYDDEWFYITNGVLDTSVTGLVPYDGEQFVFAEGRLLTEYNGLWLNDTSIGGDGQWYFIAAGQVQNVSQVVMYDGEFFVVENGVLASDYNGTIEYDGATFTVVAGQLYE